MKKNAFCICCFLVFTTAGINQQKNRGCFIRKYSTVPKSVKAEFNLYTLPPSDPISVSTIPILVEIQNAFLVYPIFYWYDDKDGNNAMATDEVIQQNGPDGTVIFGKRLFASERIKTMAGTTIPIIIAHEYGHIVDFKYGVLEHAGAKRSELFADFFAGLYMYLRVLRKEAVDVDSCYSSFRSMGDSDFSNISTHGSPKERYDALKKGYDVGESYITRTGTMNLAQCIVEGKQYVMSIKITDGAKDPE